MPAWIAQSVRALACQDSAYGFESWQWHTHTKTFHEAIFNVFSTSDSKNADVLLLSKVRFSDIFMRADARADAREPLIG